ncbi:uncharacterized protein SCHCODRAFT_067468, partial [Schizophyllum commune H4-8]
AYIYRWARAHSYLATCFPSSPVLVPSRSIYLHDAPCTYAYAHHDQVRLQHLPRGQDGAPHGLRVRGRLRPHALRPPQDGPRAGAHRVHPLQRRQLQARRCSRLRPTQRPRLGHFLPHERYPDEEVPHKDLWSPVAQVYRFGRAGVHLELPSAGRSGVDVHEHQRLPDRLLQPQDPWGAGLPWIVWVHPDHRGTLRSPRG